MNSLRKRAGGNDEEEGEEEKRLARQLRKKSVSCYDSDDEVE
jgi:hypothetical protein